MRRTAITMAAVLALGLSLAACETATPYQAVAPGGAYGFTDQQIDATHYRVTFSGNSDTSRATVENYLLYRAAELTVKQGFDWFEPTERKTNNNAETYGVGGFGWIYWGGGFGRRGGFGRGGGFFGDPFGYDDDYQTINRYQAEAEIAVGSGPKPDLKAFDAHDVVAHLGPTIVRPA